MKRSLATLFAAFVILVGTPAAAYNDAEGRVTEFTAYTLGAGQVHAGIWRVDLGITDSIDVGSYLWVWALPMPNAQVKWRFCCGEDWGLSLRTGASYTDTDLLWFVDLDEGSDGQVWVVPVELTLTWQFADAWNVSLTPAYYQVAVSGRINEDDFGGASALSNSQAVLQLEWRFNRKVSFLLSGRRLLARKAAGTVEANLELDDYTTVEVVADASGEELESPNLGNVMLSTVISWETFNLRVGAGSGNWALPVVNFLAGEKGLVLDFDMYWRF